MQEVSQVFTSIDGKVSQYAVEGVKKLNFYAKQPLFKDVNKILNSLCNYLPLVINEKDARSQFNHFQVFISHLDAIAHFLKLMHGSAVFSVNKQFYVFDQLVQEGQLLYQSHPYFGHHEKINAQGFERTENSNAAPKTDNYRREQALRAEQKRINYLNGKEKLRNFFKDIWLYALKNNIHSYSKQIFISYAWPKKGEQHEKWTRPFIYNLAKHLIFAGLRVYLDRIHSGPGNKLQNFMYMIHDVDLVMVMSSRTMDIKLKLPVSGTLYENEQIAKRTKETGRDFVLPIQFNRNNYCHPHIRDLGLLDFSSMNYLDCLKALICRIYKLDPKLFEEYWLQKLTEHKIVCNLWNIQQLNPCFFPREQLLSSLEHKFSLHSNIGNNNVVVLQGDIDSGNSQLALQYIWRNYYKFPGGIYWFECSSLERFILTSRNLIKENNLIFDPEKDADKITNEEVLALIKKYFSNQKKWLIVLENISNFNELGTIFPNGGENILITTQNCPAELAHYAITIDPFSMEEAVEYGNWILGESKINREKSDLVKLLSVLKPLTALSLAYAYGYIQRNRKSIADFLRLHYVNPCHFRKAALLPIRRINPTDEALSVDFSTIGVTTEQVASVNNFQPDILPLWQYFNEVNKLLLVLANNLVFSAVHPIIDKIIYHDKYEYLLNNQSNKNMWIDYLVLLISHLQALHYQIKIIGQHVSMVLESEVLMLPLIEKGKVYINHLLPYYIPSDTLPEAEKKEDKKLVVTANADDPEEEKKLQQQQIDFHTKVEAKDASQYIHTQFLQEIWRYAFDAQDKPGYLSKRVLIIFPWPSENKVSEQWTVDFVDILAKHLALAGLRVYFKEFNEKNDQTICEFVNKNEIDHILIFSSRELKKDHPTHKIHDQIIELVANNPVIKVKQYFLMPVLLNKINYCHDKFSKYVATYFCGNDYLKTLKELIAQIYRFGAENFDKYWRQKLLFYKLANNLWNVPPRNPNFVHREILNSIDSYFASRKTEPRVITAHHGMGGVGKTHLIIEYIYQHNHEHDEVLWFNSETKDSLIDGYIRLGYERKLLSDHDKTIEAQIKRVINWLENGPTRGILMVCDNAPNQNEIDELLPKHGVRIIITSRNAAWKYDNFSVGVYAFDEALRYIEKILGKEFIKNNQSKLNEFIDNRLKFLPLALAQACAFIKKNAITRLERYIELMVEKRDVLLKCNLLPVEENHQPVAITWNITLEQMQRENVKSVEILKYCSFLHSNKIPFALIQKLLIGSENDLVSTELVTDARRIAEEYSMISVSDECQYLFIHSILQNVVVDQLKQLQIFYLFNCINILMLQEDDEDQLSNYDLIRITLPHIKSVYHHLDYLLSSKNERSDGLSELYTFMEVHVVIRLLSRLGRIYVKFKDPKNIKEIYEKILSIQQKHFKDDIVLQTKTLSLLALAYNLLGDMQAQKTITEQALELLTLYHKGEDDEDMLCHLSSLELIHLSLGNHQIVKEIKERIANIKKKFRENNLQELLHELSNNKYYNDAERKIKLNFGQRNLAEETQILLDASRKLVSGNNRSYEDHLDKKHILEKIANIETIIQCECNLSYKINALTNIAYIYNCLDDYANSARVLESVLLIKKSMHEEGHEEIVDTKIELAKIYSLLKYKTKSKELLDECIIRINIGCYGQNHIAIAKKLNTLADVYRDFGEIDKQIELLERSLHLLERIPSINPIKIAEDLENLALIYRSAGNRSKALALNEKAYDIYKNHSDYGENHPQSQLLAAQIFISRKAAEQAAKNKPKLELIKELEQQIISDSNNCSLYIKLAGLYYSQNNLDKSIFHYLKARDFCSNTTQRAQICHNLACCYHVTGKLDLAENLFIEALRVGQRSSTFCDYGLLLFKQGKLNDAIMQFMQAISLKDNSNLTYGMLERPLLEQDLQHKITPAWSFEIHPHTFAYYYLIICYKRLNKFEESKRFLRDFSHFVESVNQHENYKIFSFACRECDEFELAYKYEVLGSQLFVRNANSTLSRDGTFPLLNSNSFLPFTPSLSAERSDLSPLTQANSAHDSLIPVQSVVIPMSVTAARENSNDTRSTLLIGLSNGLLAGLANARFLLLPQPQLQPSEDRKRAAQEREENEEQADSGTDKSERKTKSFRPAKK